jgi:predicted regulator of Ras-like GTPase activity (Roadblock/LC7/MglB family)
MEAAVVVLPSPGVEVGGVRLENGVINGRKFGHRHASVGVLLVFPGVGRAMDFSLATHLDLPVGVGHEDVTADAGLLLDLDGRLELVDGGGQDAVDGLILALQVEFPAELDLALGAHAVIEHPAMISQKLNTMSEQMAQGQQQEVVILTVGKAAAVVWVGYVIYALRAERY